MLHYIALHLKGKTIFQTGETEKLGHWATMKELSIFWRFKTKNFNGPLKFHQKSYGLHQKIEQTTRWSI